jgi:hypothetical protein
MPVQRPIAASTVIIVVPQRNERIACFRIDAAVWRCYGTTGTAVAVCCCSCCCCRRSPGGWCFRGCFFSLWMRASTALSSTAMGRYVLTTVKADRRHTPAGTKVPTRRCLVCCKASLQLPLGCPHCSASRGQCGGRGCSSSHAAGDITSRALLLLLFVVSVDRRTISRRRRSASFVGVVAACSCLKGLCFVYKGRAHSHLLRLLVPPLLGLLQGR